MFKLGEIQKLVISSRCDFGLYLTHEDDTAAEVLLPNKFVDDQWVLGDTVEVFIHRDSKDRLIATTQRPMLVLGEIALLEIVDITPIGAFLDWGLEKDLFLPFKEQKRKILKGKKYLVGLYIDKSDRLCATMDIYDLLASDAPYRAGDQASGILYALNPERGGFVAIDGKYHGFIPNKELYGDYVLGQALQCRVTDVREDGKLNLSIRKKAYQQIDEDALKLYEALKENGGYLPYNDKTAPTAIKEVFGMSKRAFKRALGRLLKDNRIFQINEGIQLKEDEKNIE